MNTPIQETSQTSATHEIKIRLHSFSKEGVSVHPDTDDYMHVAFGWVSHVAKIPVGCNKYNVRNAAHRNTKVMKAVVDAICDEELNKQFAIAHSGINIFAQDLDYDENTNELTLLVNDAKITDGGSSRGLFEDIVAGMIQRGEAKDTTIRLNFFTLGQSTLDIPNIYGKMASANNFRNVPNAASKFASCGGYSRIQDALGQYSKIIAWKHNERQRHTSAFYFLLRNLCANPMVNTSFSHVYTKYSNAANRPDDLESMSRSVAIAAEEDLNLFANVNKFMDECLWEFEKYVIARNDDKDAVAKRMLKDKAIKNQSVEPKDEFGTPGTLDRQYYVWGNILDHTGKVRRVNLHHSIVVLVSTAIGCFLNKKPGLDGVMGLNDFSKQDFIALVPYIFECLSNKLIRTRDRFDKMCTDTTFVEETKAAVLKMRTEIMQERMYNDEHSRQHELAVI